MTTKLNPTAQWLEPAGRGAAETGVAVYPDSPGVYSWNAGAAGTVTRIWVGSTTIPAASAIRAALRINAVEAAAVTVPGGGSQASASTAIALSAGDLLVVNVEGLASLGASGLVRVDGASPVIYRLMPSNPWDGDIEEMGEDEEWGPVGAFDLNVAGTWEPVRTLAQMADEGWRTIQ